MDLEGPTEEGSAFPPPLTCGQGLLTPFTDEDWLREAGFAGCSGAEPPRSALEPSRLHFSLEILPAEPLMVPTMGKRQEVL